jgi:3-deoxy-D-manno-octulosonic-acid transferase
MGSSTIPLPVRRAPPISSVYQALWRACSPLVGLALRRRVAGGLEDRTRLGERRGVDPTVRPSGRLVWIHAAGRGETVAARALIVGLRESGYEGTILATTFSPSGVSLLAGLDGVLHRFVPLDDRRYSARFLDRWRPDLGVVIEADIWPNLLWEADRRGIPLALSSARISSRSLARWQRLGRALARGVFPRFGLALTIDEEQRSRFESLGVPAVEVVGCLKAAADALPVDERLVAGLRRAANGRPVVVAASTHDGEEALILAAMAHVDALLVLAPRYVDRGAGLATLAAESERCIGRRALGQLPEPGDRRWIADSMGELGSLYEAADLVIIGGSFVPRGGHNLAEPARFGRPIVTGLDASAGAATLEALQAAGAALQVDGDGLGGAVTTLLTDPDRMGAMGDSALRIAAEWQERRRTAARRLLEFAELA